MRRIILMAMGAAAVVLGIASLASAAQVVPCKPSSLTSACTPPVIATGPSGGLGVACHKAGTRIKVPTITVTSNGGIHKITITLRSTPRVIKSFTYKRPGPLRKKLKGLVINTKGLQSGLHTLTVSAKGFAGGTTRTVRHFTICPTPKFTG